MFGFVGEDIFSGYLSGYGNCWSYSPEQRNASRVIIGIGGVSCGGCYATIDTIGRGAEHFGEPWILNAVKDGTIEEADDIGALAVGA